MLLPEANQLQYHREDIVPSFGVPFPEVNLTSYHPGGFVPSFEVSLPAANIETVFSPLGSVTRTASLFEGPATSGSVFKHLRGSHPQISGYPPMNKPLPKGLLEEDIIRHYPNHLRGILLLRISANFSPKEICTISGLKELKANTLVKRIEAARAKQDGQKKKERKRKASRETPKPTAAPEPQQAVLPDNGPESEASRRFRLEQTQLLKIMQAIDPGYMTRQVEQRYHKKPMLDRELTQRAVPQIERRRRDGSSNEEFTVESRKS